MTCELGNPKGMPIRTCSFAPGGLRKMSDRNRQSMTAQAGNAQSMVYVVTMWIYILVWVQFGDYNLPELNEYNLPELDDDMDDVDMDMVASVVLSRATTSRSGASSSSFAV